MKELLDPGKPLSQPVPAWHRKFFPSNLFNRDQRSSETKIRKIAESLAMFPEAICDAFFLEAIDASILDCNENACQMFGYPKDEITTLIFFDLVPEEIADTLPEFKARLLLEGSFKGELIGRRKDGSIFPVEARAKVFTLNEEKVVAVHVQDLTNRKKVEETMRKSVQELKDVQLTLIHAEKMVAMGKLAAGISHELYQPLTGIKGFAQAALFDLDIESPLREFLLKILEQTERMSSIIANIRAFVKKTEFLPNPLDITCPIEACLSLLGAQLRAHGIQIEKNFYPGLPKIKADPNQLQQVFINIIINAKEALESRGVRHARKLTISTSYHRSNGLVVVILQDTGPGIAKDKLDKIFEPFFTTKPKENSMGLGLSIVQKIIDNHSGHIAVESVLGKGTIFTISLPACKENPA